MNKVRYGYLKIADDNPERIVIIDGNRDIGSIASEIWGKMKKLHKELK